MNPLSGSWCPPTTHALTLGTDPTEKGRLWSLTGQCCPIAHYSVTSGQPSASGACLNWPRAILPPEALPFPSVGRHCSLALQGPVRGSGKRVSSEQLGLRSSQISPEGSGGEKRGPEGSRATASFPDTPGSSLCSVWPGVRERPARLEATLHPKWAEKEPLPSSSGSWRESGDGVYTGLDKN